MVRSLDDAAREFAVRLKQDGAYLEWDEQVAAAFKAGVEWQKAEIERLRGQVQAALDALEKAGTKFLPLTAEREAEQAELKRLRAGRDAAREVVAAADRIMSMDDWHEIAPFVEQLKTVLQGNNRNPLEEGQ